MKLLDLQTGKYLELFKDYAYCGNAILFHGFDDDCLPTFTNGFENMINQDWACCGEICYKTEPQEPLKTLCEKTGAVVYGGRYVLINEIDVWVYNNDLQPKKIQTGDVIKEKTSHLYTIHTLINVSDFFLDTTENLKTTHKIGKKAFNKFDFFAIENIIGNVFEEYSKQLRNEPNKFEELMELIK